MKINTLHNLLSTFLISRYLRSLTFLCAILFFGFNGFGQSVTIEDENGNEDDGSITITATLDIAVPGGFTVDVSTADGTATIADNDYTAVSSFTLTFAGNPGEQQFFTVLPTSDSFVELDENLTVSMGNLQGTVESVNITDSATITINNDDSYIASITANDPTATEAGTTTGQFTVDLGTTNTTGSAIVVNFNIATGGSNATNTTDYANIGTSVSIANGAQTGLVTITPVDDVLVEGPETVILTLAAGTGYAVAGAPNNTATVTIADNDSYTASITANDPTATEAGTTTGQFTVDLGTTNTTGSAIVVNFNIATGGSNATNTTDYANIGTSVSIANGAQTGLVTITPVDDVLVEGPETVILTLAAGTGYAVAGAPNNTATVTIADNDSYTASITANDPTATEAGTTTGQFTVDLGTTNTTGSAIVVNFNIATGGSNATNTTDYANIGTSVSIANGAQTGLVTITPVDDVLVEGPETVILTLAAGTGYAVAGAPNNTATVTIADNDSYTASITANDPTATEAGTTTGQFTVDLGTTNTTGSAIVVNFNIATGGSNATNTTDYANIGTSVSIANGAQTGLVTITPVDDVLVEGPETVILTLAAGTGYAVAGAPNNTATVTIADNDSYTASITANDPTATEAGTTTGQFTVDLGTTNTTGSAIVVNFNIATGGSNATNTTDYANIGTSVSIANGAQTGLVTITPVDDVLVEGPETVILTLAAGTGYAVAGAPNNTATVTIADNDSYTASITANDPTATEAGTTTGQFTVDLGTTNTTGSAIVVNFNIATGGSNATNTTDYANIGTSVSIANGAQTGLVTITPVDDVLVEGPETVILTLAAGTGYAVAGAPNNTATVTIADNDSYTASITANDPTATEAGTTTGQFTVDLGTTNTTGSAIVVNFNIATGGSNATNTTDYANIGTSVSIANGAQTGLVTITPVDDVLVEGPETVILTLAAGTGYAVAGAPNNTATVTIADNDSYTASITANDPTATEAGTTTGQFTVDLGTTNTTGSAIVVNFNIATGGSNATNTTDYANIGTSVSIANGQRTGQITITPVDDGIAEGSETVILTLAAGTGYAVVGAPNNTATVTIADNDTAGVSIDDVSVNEGDGTATFTVTLNGAVFLGTIVSYSTANNTALAGSDYDAETGNVTFLGLNGETRTITIDISEDILVEGTETFFVNLTNATGFAQLGKTQGIGTILDNDSYIATISATDADAAENPLNTGTFTVGLNTANLTGSPMVINYTVGGTAVSGSDYIALAGSVSIGNGQESAFITLNPINDSEVEAGLETVIVSLASDTGYIVGAPSSATVNIASEDVAGISIDDVVVNENDATATFTVTLNANVPAGASVDYSTANNTATAGTDYTAESGTLTFLGLNNETQTIVVDIIEDAVAEGTESFFVNLSNPIGLIQIDKDQGVGTIADNDNCIEAPLINSTPTIFCDAFIQDLDAYTDTTIPAGFELIWSSNSDFSVTGARLNTSVIDFEATFYGFLYNESTGCVSPPLEVTLVRNEPPEILGTTPATICGTGMATISATVTAGGSLFWYASESGGTSLEEGSSFSTSVSGTTTYYVEAFANGCFSEREAVTITVNDLVDTGTITDTSACSIPGGGPTTLDLDDTRAGGTAGVWTIVGTPPSTITIGADNIVDFEGAADGDYVFRFTTNTAVSPCVDESVDVTISVTTCTMDSDGDGLFDRDETDLGLDPTLRDTDADGIEDGVEVGPDVNNPIDTDGDGIIDALDSNILDSDNDGVVDQLDPANTNPCIPNISTACRIDLALEKTVDKESILVGREVIFTITLTNLSQIMVTNIAVNDLVSPATGFQYVSSSATKGIYDPVAGVWQLDEVLADEVNTLTITAEVPEIGTYQNIAAIVDSFPEDSNATNDRATASVTVTPRSSDECGFLFNQISPNGDGINDMVYINCITDYPNNTLQIFDRYGNEVFSVNGYDNTWMGTGKNGDLPKGTYFYILDLGDGTEVRKGWIQIIR